MSLEEKSLKELTAHYNSLPDVKVIKMFKDKPTALKRIKEMEKEPVAKEPKVKEPKAPKEAKLTAWIAFISQSESEYRVVAKRDLVLKLGRPHDFNGKPMIALRKGIEAALVKMEL